MGLVSNLVRLLGVTIVVAAALRTREAYFAVAAAFTAVVGATVFKNVTAKFVPPKASPVPPGKIRICVAGFTHSSPTAKAHYLVDMIAKRYPDKYESWYYFDQYTFFQFTKWKFDAVPFPQHLKGHETSPFCWLEDSKGKITPLGGSEHISEWTIGNIEDADSRKYAEEPWKVSAYLDGSAYHHLNAPATAAPAA